MSSETVEDNGNSIPATVWDAGVARDSAATIITSSTNDGCGVLIDIDMARGMHDAVHKKVGDYFRPKPEKYASDEAHQEMYDEADEWAHQDIFYNMQSNFNSAYKLLEAYDQTTGIVTENRMKSCHSILLAAMLYSACKADAGLKRDLATIITSITDEYLLDLEYVKKMIEYDSCNDDDDVNIEYIPAYLHSMQNFNFI